MKLFFAILALTLTYNSYAQSTCNPASISTAAANIKTIEHALTQIHVEEMDELVPSEVSKQITELKDNLTSFADASLACAQPNVNPLDLQKTFSSILYVTPPANEKIDDETIGSYGHNLRISINRPKIHVDLLEIQFSFNIECGDDTLLLIYQLEGDHWKQMLRWQAQPLKQISDAFGDFLLTSYLDERSATANNFPKWGIVAAHGTDWCTSRFSNFKIDLLYPTLTPASPEVAWHTNRSLSRGDFEPRLKSFNSTFEFRINAPCIDVTSYERHVIYSYEIDAHHLPHRIQPIATNARGFVEEWFESPWSESHAFINPENSTNLKKIYDQYNTRTKETDNRFMEYSYGPVRACTAKKNYQVEIDLTLNTIVPGKPGGDSESKGAWYFHLHELSNGYELLSATTTADPTCTGSDLMPINGNTNR